MLLLASSWLSGAEKNSAVAFEPFTSWKIAQPLPFVVRGTV
jgi:hypothetical protein